jgi:ABC-type transport system substrate-binding protein
MLRTAGKWTIAASLAGLFVASVVSLPGCGADRARVRGATTDWVASRAMPVCDPDGPPDALRWTIERALSRGLTDEDSSGVIVPAAAESIAVSDAGLTYTFRLRPHLTFADGHACTSADFRSALESGLARTDHSTRQGLLAAVRGVDAVRAHHELPRLGIETPDERTLVIRLTRPDTLLLRKLSLPGVSTPWRDRAAREWKAAVGLGPYRVAAVEADRALVLTRAGRGGAIDTLRVRFVTGVPRVRSLMRARRVDLLWPVPPGLLDQTLSVGYRVVRSVARPARNLLLVIRADVPPTTHQPAREALVHSLRRGELAAALGATADAPDALVPGAARFEFADFDAEQVAQWLDRGKLGRSFHVTMAFDADGLAIAARALQGAWSRANLYIELRPLRAGELSSEALGGQSQLLLTEHQPLWDAADAMLLALVMPMRGAAAGPFRTGWRTRDFDAWIAGRRGAPRLDADALQTRIDDERIVLPLARLPWVRIEREGAAAAPFHPHFGPDFAGRFRALAAMDATRRN